MAAFNTIDEILEDLRRGKMAVIMDDEDRENEGDLIMAAECVRPEDVNFMARYGRGLICLTLTRERCRQLRLPLMVSDTDSSHRTNFTLSIEAAEGVTTGISAHDRAHTVKTAVAPNARPEDLRQPGHIFPLMAQPGGVLTRAGHTEAGCDLARLAGFSAAAMIVEILNDDGSMARRPDLELFARNHGLKIGTIADLIRYRLKNERSVERIYDQPVDTEYGDFRLYCYEDHVNKTVHIALVKGDLNSSLPPLVRVHIKDTLRDVVGVRSERLGWPLRAAMLRVAKEASGVVIILRPEESPREFMESIGQLDSKPAQQRVGATVVRTYGIGAQILKDLGLKRMRVLSAPKQLQGLAAFDLEITSYVDGDD
ncbi:MAG: 3,4-dihydroxy 2-butanone 4-phosphate synthase / cyclohydrolase [Gammaproteobacteria bacterium]|jgi:3,4-dihydroxy 2-butanone 4-phosphate synthase/GTP cyclohydrolase II|nr:3,4-dihydroxy-2-butanone 4-phosphate synthase [Gammaproteobacteria bacterium]MEA3139115.1 3,4-dihydroxy 2-butanone 4-phosphate synthase / cyclohydrolase [Gammaproteobacteria bacterium]